MKESQVESHLVAATRVYLGGLALKLTSPGTAGVPDRLVLLPCGCHRLVELKAPTGRLAPLQIATFARLDGIGHPVRVIYSMHEVDDWAAEQSAHIASCRSTE